MGDERQKSLGPNKKRPYFRERFLKEEIRKKNVSKNLYSQTKSALISESAFCYNLKLKLSR
jgi:hypothetical protein